MEKGKKPAHYVFLRGIAKVSKGLKPLLKETGVEELLSDESCSLIGKPCIEALSLRGVLSFYTGSLGEMISKSKIPKKHHQELLKTLGRARRMFPEKVARVLIPDKLTEGIAS